VGIVDQQVSTLWRVQASEGVSPVRVIRRHELSVGRSTQGFIDSSSLPVARGAIRNQSWTTS